MAETIPEHEKLSCKISVSEDKRTLNYTLNLRKYDPDGEIEPESRPINSIDGLTIRLDPKIRPPTPEEEEAL